MMPRTSVTLENTERPSLLRNTSERWGLIAAAFHWITALTIIGLFALGLWMTGLSYYDPWYRQAPDIHRSIGVLLFIAMLARLVWRIFDPVPAPVPSHKRWEIKAAHVVHGLLYAGLFVVMISGYLISTADGRSISVFGLFEVPATITSIEKQEDVAGWVHYWLAIGLIAVAALHALAALKHHIIDKDTTLMRMFTRS